MRLHFLGALLIILFFPAFVLSGQTEGDFQEALSKGTTALKENRWHDAAEAFQHAVDVNPSSSRAHEGLGLALSKEIMAGDVGPSDDSDILERAESHFRQASELAPSALAPILSLADLEIALAERQEGSSEKFERYQNAQEALKRAVALDPNKPELYLRLATVERDQFGPPLQAVRKRFTKSTGILPEAKLRHSLQEQYGTQINDAITNAQTALEMNGSSNKPMLLMARLLRDRALIREAVEDRMSDLRSADEWERQFLAAGGHLGDLENRVR